MEVMEEHELRLVAELHVVLFTGFVTSHDSKLN